MSAAPDKHQIDYFWIDIDLHHTCDAGTITEALGMTPWIGLNSGKVIGPIIRKSTWWASKFRSGLTNEEFGLALEDLLTFLESHNEFLKGLIAEGGEITLSINQNVGWDDGVILQLQLQPEFIGALGKYPVRLKIQAWSTDETLSKSENTE